MINFVSTAFKGQIPIVAVGILYGLKSTLTTQPNIRDA